MSGEPRGDTSAASALVDKRMWVRLKDGRTVWGYLQCVDKQGNLILYQATEMEPNQTKDKEGEADAAKRSRGVGTVLIPPHYRVSCHAEVPVEHLLKFQLSLEEATT